MSKYFISRLKELRGSMSTSAFARMLDMPQTTLNSYFNGIRKPSVELVKRICVKCGCTADWLLGLSDVRDYTKPSAPSAAPPQTKKNLGRLSMQSDADLLDEIRALKARVAALESQPAFACG